MDGADDDRGEAPLDVCLAIAFPCFAIAATSSVKHTLPAPALSIAVLVLILAAYVLASRFAYREAGS